jgi:PAS domain S-box-containing protein
MMVPVSVEMPSWEQFIGAVPVPLAVFDEAGRQLGANRAFGELLGYSPDELDRIDVERVLRSRDRTFVRTHLERLAAGEIDRFSSDVVIVRRDGSELAGHLALSALRDEAGHYGGTLAAVTPIEARAPSDASRLERLLQFTNDTLTIVDPDGNVIEATGRHTQILGYPPVFWEHRNIRDVVRPEDWDRLLELRDRLTPGSAAETEVEVIAGDGSTQTVHVRAFDCRDDPDIDGIVIVSRNITDFVRTVADLSRQRATAEAVVDAQSRLLATVSHELRNPLHAVRGLAELLAAEELPPAASDLAASLLRQVSGLAHVTQDLLDAARLDAGGVAIEASPTDLLALLDDVVALGRAAAGEQQVTVTSRVAHDVPAWVVADADRVRQVLGNLVGNAVKFTERGAVRLVVRTGRDGEIVFSVIDTGVGIPQDEQSAVLEPFTIASTAGERRGAGLGLSIVQRLVSAMDGRLELTSTPGSGSRFDVHLPLTAAATPEGAESARAPAGLVVLVVEDNPVNQQLARSQLERLGLVPLVVGSGEEALELLRSRPTGIDVILMDHQLPGISGVETTRRIRRTDGGAADIPIVGLSASASTSDRDAFVAAGMDEFVAKPASLDDLSRAIAGVLSRRVDSGTSAPGLDRDVLDRDVLEALVVDLGGEAIVSDLVRTFLAELPDRTAVMRRDVDVDASRRAAHVLKSSARLLGAGALAGACQQIEQGGSPSDDVLLLADLTSEALEGWLADVPTTESTSASGLRGRSGTRHPATG